MAADNNDINSGSETESDLDDYNPSPSSAKTFARHATAVDEETRRRMAAGAAASSAKRQQSLPAAPSSAATASQAGSPRMMYHPYHHHHGQPASIEPGPDAYYHQQQQLMQVQHQQLHPHHLQQQQQQQQKQYHDSMMMMQRHPQHPQYPQYAHPQYAVHHMAAMNIPPPPGVVARAEVHVAATNGAGGASSHIKQQQYPHQHHPHFYAVPMAALNNIPHTPPPPPAVTPTRAPPGGGGEGVVGQTQPPPPPPPPVVVVVDLESQHNTSKTTTTTTKTQENDNKSTTRLLNHDLSLLPKKKKTQKKRESIATVRVQVPHEKLLPGNKMLVELAGTCPEYQHLPPFEVVVPPTVTPGMIITVQIPTTINEEEDGILMHHPAYAAAHSSPTDQQQQQESEQEKYLKKKRKRGPYKKKVPPPPDTPTTTSITINSSKNGIPHSKTTDTTTTSTTVTCRAEKQQQWRTVFQRLKVYQQEHPQKSTRVPRHYHHDAELGRWVQQQRLNQQQELLTEEQQHLLQSIEFDFAVGPTRVSDVVWSDMYPQLVVYHTKHGHTKLKKKLGAETQLMTWAAGQRTRYHKTPRTLSAEHLLLLQQVDFDFEMSFEKNWRDKYQLLIDYKQQHQGNTRAPKSHPTLGLWVAAQRNKEHTMTKARHALLCQIDFDWEKGFTKNTAWLETKIRTEVGGYGRSSAAFLKKEKEEQAQHQQQQPQPEEDDAAKQHTTSEGNIPTCNNNTNTVLNMEAKNSNVDEQNYELKYV